MCFFLVHGWWQQHMGKDGGKKGKATVKSRVKAAVRTTRSGDHKKKGDMIPLEAKKLKTKKKSESTTCIKSPLRDEEKMAAAYACQFARVGETGNERSIKSEMIAHRIIQSDDNGRRLVTRRIASDPPRQDDHSENDEHKWFFSDKHGFYLLDPQGDSSKLFCFFALH